MLRLVVGKPERQRGLQALRAHLFAREPDCLEHGYNLRAVARPSSGLAAGMNMRGVKQTYGVLAMMLADLAELVEDLCLFLLGGSSVTLPNLLQILLSGPRTHSKTLPNCG